MTMHPAVIILQKAITELEAELKPLNMITDKEEISRIKTDIVLISNAIIKIFGRNPTTNQSTKYY